MLTIILWSGIIFQLNAITANGKHAGWHLFYYPVKLYKIVHCFEHCGTIVYACTIKVGGVVAVTRSSPEYLSIFLWWICPSNSFYSDEHIFPW
jgi:hypothetical protein